MNTRACTGNRRLAATAAAALVIAATLPAIGSGQDLFDDATAAAGISAIQQGYLSPGIAWGDCNNDAIPDVFLSDSFGPNVLYLGNGDGSFSVASMSGDVALADRVSGGAVFGDYDNDGWLDLYVLHEGANVLFHNDAGAGFTDVTDQAGVGDLGLGQTGAWGDYDRDGFLDLYASNWLCNSCPDGARDRLYHNNGDGSFTDVTEALHGLTDGPTFVTGFLDYDSDGDLDLYLVLDKAYSGTPPPPHPGHNVLLRNDGPGCTHWCFSDVSAAAGADIGVDGMGLAIGDYDNDDDLDLYFSNGGPMVLLENQTAQGSHSFIDVSAAAGVDFSAIGWGTIFLDYDNDRWLDLYLATMNSEPVYANRLFHNSADGSFADLTASSGAANNGPTFAVAYCDYDRDGWLDFMIGNIGVGYVLYRNAAIAGDQSWLRLRLIGGGPVNKDAIGSRVRLATSGGLSLMQEVKSGSSMASGNDMALHFGLADDSLLSLEVRWPDGLVESFPPGTLDRERRLYYPVEVLSPGADDLVELLRVMANPGHKPAGNPDPNRDGEVDGGDVEAVLEAVFS